MKRFLLLIICYLLLVTMHSAFAINMSSDNYKIQWGNINIGSEKQSSTNYNLGVTMGQVSPGLYTNTGYKVRAGFQYIHSIVPFSFEISDLSIALGTLAPQTPGTDTNDLTVSSRGAGGYQVLAFESHPLRSDQGTDIVDTLCDNGNCDETSAEVWSQSTTYGFGFNINGNDTPADFIDTTYFRQFADNESAETPQTVMSSNQVVDGSTATVTYKANVSGIQAAGDYETNIVYIAVPGY